MIITKASTLIPEIRGNEKEKSRKRIRLNIRRTSTP
jgi:hypothetical protein